MGNAEIQGRLWGTHARDYAERLEQIGLPLFAAVLDAAHVTSGARLFDAGCGAGLLSLLASLRGAHVTALDASAALVEIARERLPRADIRIGELETLPFEDGSFDAVAAVNSVFYAQNMAAAMRELARVTRSGGRVVVTAWGSPERCEFLRDVMPLVAPLMPPPPPNAAAHPVLALSQPGALRAEVETAGMRVVDQGEVACPFVFPNADAAWRANASAGPNQVAIAHSGETAVRAAFAQADRSHTRQDGSVRYENVFQWVAGVRP
jgi:SAM-dependent methyltransferase